MTTRSKSATVALSLSLTPAGRLSCLPDPEASSLPVAIAEEVVAAFAVDAGHGLLQLGSAYVAMALPPVWAYWRDFAVRYLTALCVAPDAGTIPPPDTLTLETLILDVPPMPGAEYLSPEILAALWGEIGTALESERSASGLSLAEFLKVRHPAWNLVGRVYFNLAENRKDPDMPFAFLATYTTRLSTYGKAQHLPLSQALVEFSGSRKRAQLLALLMPIQRAAEQCEWIAAMIESGEIYHPLRWQVEDAICLLDDLPRIEAAGIVVRMPAQWQAGRPARPRARAALGAGAPSRLGLDALLDFRMDVTINGEALTAEEIRAMLAGADGLQWIRGKWIEVDRKQLSHVIDRFREIEAGAADGLRLAEAMRLLAGATLDEEAPDPDWAELAAGPWLAKTLRGLRAPGTLATVDPGSALNAILRPYQQEGVRWLSFLTRLGLGACLADDMGLGKTIQVLALLLLFKRDGTDGTLTARPSLLVAPASLLANWMQEAARFAPDLRCMLAHPSGMTREALQALDTQQLTGVDLVVTAYGTLPRLPKLREVSWRLVVIDEAQVIQESGS